MDLLLPGGASLFGSSDYMDSTNARHSNATEDDLIDALTALERGDIEFVIVEDPQTKMFMQTSGGPSEGYYLEYNDGTDDTMYHAQNQALSGAQITDAFAAFFNQDSAWRTMFVWER